jgi:hypothetical protein
MFADFEGVVHAVHVDHPGLTAYAARGEDGMRVLLVNRSLEPVEVALTWDDASAGGPLEVVVLDEATFDELLEPREHVQDASEPLAVPARSVVRVAGPP